MSIDVRHRLLPPHHSQPNGWYLGAVGRDKFRLECFVWATFTLRSFQHFFVPCFALFNWRCRYVCQHNVILTSQKHWQTDRQTDTNRQTYLNIYSKHPMGCKAQSAWKCLFMSTSSAGDFDPKVGQTDLVFVTWSGFTSRSAHAKLQVSVCSGYDLFHIHTRRQHFDQLVWKLSQQS